MYDPEAQMYTVVAEIKREENADKGGWVGAECRTNAWALCGPADPDAWVGGAKLESKTTVVTVS
jgi:hypothetical protein